MDKTTDNFIKLIVKDAVVTLVDGNQHIVSSYRFDEPGVYLIDKKTFHPTPGEHETTTLTDYVIFYPWHEVYSVVFSVPTADEKKEATG